MRMSLLALLVVNQTVHYYMCCALIAHGRSTTYRSVRGLASWILYMNICLNIARKFYHCAPLLLTERRPLYHRAVTRGAGT